MPPKIASSQAFVVTNTTIIASFLDLKEKFIFRRVSRNAEEGVQRSISTFISELSKLSLYFRSFLKVEALPTSFPGSHAETTTINLDAAETSFHKMLHILMDTIHPASLNPIREEKDIIERVVQLNQYYIKVILNECDKNGQMDALKLSLCKVLLKQGKLGAVRHIIAIMNEPYEKALAQVELFKSQPTQENLQKTHSIIATIRVPHLKAHAQIELFKSQPTQENLQKTRSIIATIHVPNLKARAQIELIKAYPTPENMTDALSIIATINDAYKKALIQIEFVKVHPTQENLQEAYNLIAMKQEDYYYHGLLQIELVKTLLSQDNLPEARSVIAKINDPYLKVRANTMLIKILPTQENIKEARNLIATIKYPIQKTKAQEELEDVIDNRYKTLQLAAPISNPTDEIPLQIRSAQIATLQGDFKRALQLITEIKDSPIRAQAQIACFEILFTNPSAIKFNSAVSAEIGLGPGASGLSLFHAATTSSAAPSQPALSRSLSNEVCS